MTTAIATDWRAYLRQRGIWEASQEEAIRWSSPAGDYIEYVTVDENGKPWQTPLGQPSKRHILWNRQTDQRRFYFSPPKPNGWKGDEQFHPIWWTPPDLWGSVQKANGSLVLACGETDLLTHRAAGIKHVTTFYGEGNFTKIDLPATLAKHNVHRVSYFPDRDLTGYLDAAKLWLLFKRANIMGLSFSTFEIPPQIDEMPLKDMNDMWQALGFDSADYLNKEHYPKLEPFRLFDLLTNWYLKDEDDGLHALSAQLGAWQRSGDLDVLRMDNALDDVFKRWHDLDALVVVERIQNRADRKAAQRQLDEGDGLLEGLWSMIEMAAESTLLNGGTLEYKSDGWSQNFPCPIHNHAEDHSQSHLGFGINRDTRSGFCFKRNESVNAMRLAEAYHINWRQNSNTGLKSPESGLKRDLPSIHKRSAETTLIKAPTSRFVSVQQAAAQTVASMRRWHADPREVRGLATGISKTFDRKLHGVWMEPEGDLMVILARPGNGKSTLMLQIALRLSLIRPVYFVSPEMSPAMQTLRIGSIGAGYNIHDLLSGKVSNIEQVSRTYLSLIADRQIHFLDGSCTLQDLKGDPNRGIMGIGDYVIEQGGILIADSIQNIKGANPNEKGWSFIEDVMVELERIALRVPVLGTAQANRDSANRSDKTPQYTDAAGGSAIEGHAKRLIAVHRPWLDAQIGGGRVDADPTEAMMTVLKDRLTGFVGEQIPIGFGVTGQGGYGFYGLHSDSYERLMETTG